MIQDLLSAAPTRRKRLVIAILVALWAAATAWRHARYGETYRDFDQLWYAARAILDGRNPYAEICPGCPFDWTHFYYPLTAAITAMPFAWLPRAAADAAFAAFGAGALAWVLGGRSYGVLLGITSPALVYAIETVQWSPVLAASAALPPLALLYVAKPTIGLAFFLAWPRWIAVAGGVMVFGISLWVQPDWIGEWRQALDTTATASGEQGIPYLAPVVLPAGFLILLALLRWRLPEARLLVVLGCIPQTLLLYETVPLLLVPRSWKESLFLVGGGHAALAWIRAAEPFNTRIDWYLTSGTAMVACCYLPAVIMLLRRPNVGAMPAWLETTLRSVRVPRWLAGTPESIAGV